MKKIRINRGFFKHSYHMTLIQKKVLYWLLVHRPKDEFEYWCSVVGFYKKHSSFKNVKHGRLNILFDVYDKAVYKQLVIKGRNIYVEFDKQALDYISNGKHNTNLNLEDVLKIKSLGVLNLYELLMSYKRYKEITVGLDVLKQMTGCENHENHTFMVMFRRWYENLKEFIDFDFAVNNELGIKRIKSITFKFNRSKKV